MATCSNYCNFFYKLMEVNDGDDGEPELRRIFTFESEEDANGALEFFIGLGYSPHDFIIEEVEVK